MAQPTNIEWTEQSWNFLRGCRRVSEGCRNCYAERQAIRHSGPGEPYHGLVQSTPNGPRWTGELSFHEHILVAPLKRKKPTTYFVNSMSDLFYEKVTDEMLDKAFAVMALTPQHTYQILTKRPDRMMKWLTSRGFWPIITILESLKEIYPKAWFDDVPHLREIEWPLINVWLGVSVEDQKTADERIPLLLRTPAAVRWISAEPLIGPVDLNVTPPNPGAIPVNGATYDDIKGCLPKWQAYPMRAKLSGGLDWVVVGGESGPGARPFNIEWARAIVEQCKAANVPVFMKQLGAAPFEVARYKVVGDAGLYLSDRKGGNMTEWPHDLQIREFPV